MGVDVTVLGAGVFGLSVAYAAVQAGARVRVIDPHGVAAGASGGLVGALAPHTPDNWNAKKQFQFDSLILSRSFWPDVEAASGNPTGYTRAGRLQPILQEKQIPLALARADQADKLWQGKATWTVRHSAKDPWSPPSPTGQVIFDDLSAHIHPRQATQALARAVQALGGDVVAKGALQGAVVDATGWDGLRTLSVDMGRDVGNGVKGQAALLDFAAPHQPQLFADGLHIVPHADGTTAIGSTSERDFKHATRVDGQVDDIVAKAKRLYPQLRGADVLERWAGVRPRALTRAPLLGRHPTKDGWFVANGGFKIGFGMAPLAGQVLARLILENTNDIPPDFDAALVLGED